MSTNVARRVRAFFYGSFIRKDVLGRVGFVPTIEVARLDGFEIHVAPHAALSPSPGGSVYGILVEISHKDLAALYSMDGVGTFLPEAVLVSGADGRFVPALCYIPPNVGTAPPDPVYLEKLVEAGSQYGFPGWYLAKLRSLATGAKAAH